ncbi:hypothetical protein PIB30_063160 [Stylosanthes scabra]|uniref:GRF-type domain-containing protein n=1 Tax=Stylosanthes scabra TaxID=79078 RepID=A0ABU6WJQ3_9FABA|nr:hypothetical protein [Stylosanthes scabra]
MESDGCSPTSRRSAGGGMGFFAAKAGDESDRAPPKCHCGVYAVLYLLKTPSNPNRLFFGCLFFKIRERHCKFFLWLDKHVAKFGRADEVKACREEHDDVEVQFVRLKIETQAEVTNWGIDL